MATNGYKLSMAEFKGKVLESLKNLEEDVAEIKRKNSEQHGEFYTRIRKLEKKPSFSINPLAYIATALGLRK